MRDSLNFNDGWLISPDPENVGREQGYAAAVRSDALPVPVPGIIQQVLYDYHGVVWYYKKTNNPFYGVKNKRIILSFGAVDYYSDTYVDGVKVYSNEGPEKPFEIDVTDKFKGKKEVLIAVRVINPPCGKVIDGLERKKIPRRNIEEDKFRAGASYNGGGITLPVTLSCIEDTYITDVYAKNDMHTGDVKLFVSTKNHRKKLDAEYSIEIFERSALKPCKVFREKKEVPQGEGTCEIDFTVEAPLLWSVEEPNLYRYVVRAALSDGREMEAEITTGFREFIVKDGFFFLNGKRIFLKSAHTGNNFPIGVTLAAIPGMQYDDLRLAKAAGFNCIRFIATAATPEQLDYCDSLGLMVYQETMASWYLGDSPRAKDLYYDSYCTMIKRDRNHPCMTIIGLLNETNVGDSFYAAKGFLPTLRKFDDTRLIIFSSGRFDLTVPQKDYQKDYMLGSFANPGKTEWECQWGDEGIPDGKSAGDVHNYMGVPLDTSKGSLNRVAGHDLRGPVFISEFGVGSQEDVLTSCKEFQMHGIDVKNPDYLVINEIREAYLEDFKKYNCYDVYAEPEDFLQDSLRHNAHERRISFDIVRSNPRCCGYNVTGLLDHCITGEGPITLFRNFKPGHYDAFRDGFSKLRWCLFVSKGNVYSDEEIELEAVLANEDVLRDGEYTAVFALTNEQGTPIKKWERKFTLPIYGKEGYPELAFRVFDEKVVLNVPEGRYRFKAYLKNGGAPDASVRTFYVSERIKVTKSSNVLSFYLPENAREYLRSVNVETTEISKEDLKDPDNLAGKKILVGPLPKDKALKLAQKLMNASKRGAKVIYLDPLTFDDSQPAAPAMPLEHKMILGYPAWVYHKDVIVKDTEITKNVKKGFAEWDYYCGAYPHICVLSDTMPSRCDAMFFAVGNFEWVTGINEGKYHAGVNLGEYTCGKGSFTINTFNVLGGAGHCPAGDRILFGLATE